MLQKIAYLGWPNCYRLTNERIELIVTADVGPRIIYLGSPAGENLFAVLPEQAVLIGGDEWRLYGGHRLWHAPQARPRTELPDNAPIQVVSEGPTLRLVPPAETAANVQKEIAIRLVNEQPHVEVRHILRNIGLWPIELAPWAISAMNVNGIAIAPHSQTPTPHQVLPNRVFALWPFSDGQDPRLHWGTHYTMLRQDPTDQRPFKIGLNVTDGWAAYHRGEQLFVKCFACDSKAVYPDFGSTVELFVCGAFLELETLGPLVRLQPGEATEHREYWFLFDQVKEPANEEEVERTIRPLAEQAMSQTPFSRGTA
jgi:hypothetical protein